MDTNTQRNWFKPQIIIAIILLVVAVVLAYRWYGEGRSVPTSAAPVNVLTWDILEPDITVSSKIYRTTESVGFLEDPDPQYLKATVPAPTNTYNDTDVAMGTTYFYSIFVVDDTGVEYDPSYIEMMPTDSPSDTTPPTVSITAPPNNATVSGVENKVTVSANDNVGVVGVQFKLDGNNLGSEFASPPYSVNLDTTQVANGTHSLTAIARDAAGNSRTSSAVSVTVNNPTIIGTVTTPTFSPDGGSFSSAQEVTLSTITAGTTIYYTTNGSNPTTGSTLYSAPFKVTSTTTVKALATKAGMINSAIASATFTINASSSGGGGGGGASAKPSAPTKPITPPTSTPSTPSTPSGVVLPTNVIAGQVIKFPDSSTIYLVQSTGLHPFDTWSSFQAYQAQSGAQIITRQGTASSYTVSSPMAKTILGQSASAAPAAPAPAPATTMPNPGDNFVCQGNPTIYYNYNGQKQAYSELAVWQAWNGNSFASVKTVASSACSSIGGSSMVRLPEGTFIKVAGGSEIYRTEGTTVRPYASYAAYLRDSAGKTTYTISVPYLHTYSRGAAIN